MSLQASKAGIAWPVTRGEESVWRVDSPTLFVGTLTCQPAPGTVFACVFIPEVGEQQHVKQWEDVNT